MNVGYSSSSRMQPGYGQPAGGPPPMGQQPMPQPIVVNQATPQVVNVVGAQTFGTVPVSITCQFCKNPVTTTVEKSCSCGACCLCMMTGFIFYACIQCCRGKEICCCDAVHKCPSCQQQLGAYQAC